MGLDRYIAAQDEVVNERGDTSFEVACFEIIAGKKETHWMWWIFPQQAGHGYSFNAHLYDMSDATEAQAYMRNPVLRERYLIAQTCVWNALREHQTTVDDIFGPVDTLKYRSSTELLVRYA